MNKIKAIETQYKGYRFRSRLEARWAVFFDALGIEWEYEAQGYELPDGTRYLPDFWLPTFNGGMFVEVKPIGGDFAKARMFAEVTKSSMWLAYGTPSAIFYEVGYANKVSTVIFEDEVLALENYNGDDSAVISEEIEMSWGDGAPNWDEADGENRMYAFNGYLEIGEELPDKCSGNVHLAVQAARSARFEHGENG